MLPLPHGQSDLYRAANVILKRYGADDGVLTYAMPSSRRRWAPVETLLNEMVMVRDLVDGLGPTARGDSLRSPLKSALQFQLPPRMFLKANPELLCI